MDGARLKFDSSKPVFDLFGVLRRRNAFSLKSAYGNATQVAAIVLVGVAELEVCCHWMGGKRDARGKARQVPRGIRELETLLSMLTATVRFWAIACRFRRSQGN